MEHDYHDMDSMLWDNPEQCATPLHELSQCYNDVQMMTWLVGKIFADLLLNYSATVPVIMQAFAKQGMVFPPLPAANAPAVNLASEQWVTRLLTRSGIAHVSTFGAKEDGVTNDTAALNAAIASLDGPGVVLFSRNMLIDPIALPIGVTLRGTSTGPFSNINHTNVSTFPVLLVNSTGAPLITMASEDSHVMDCAIFYPQQVPPTASAPNVYPAAINSPQTNGGNTVERVTIINAYAGITGAFSRGGIFNCWIGAFSNGITIDYTADFATISNVFHQVMWDIYAGASYPQPIDTWVQANGTALQINRADAISVVTWGVFGHGTGIKLTDSPDTNQTPRNGYGTFVDTDIDTCTIGVDAISTDDTGGGFSFTNLGTNASMVLSAGGSSAPHIYWYGGIAGGVPGPHYQINAGLLEIYNVRGITDAPSIPTLIAPAVPASGTALVNPFPFPVAVYATGGAVTDYAINGQSIGTIGTTNLRPGDQVTVIYTAAPTWVWSPTA